MKTIEVLIALFLAYIAYQNYVIQNKKLRLDLFDKRYKVFQAVKDLLKNSFVHGIPRRESLNKFNLETWDAEFLFDDDDIKIYIEEIRSRTLSAIHQEESLLRNPSADERVRIAGELEVFENWVTDQPIFSKTLFKKYLHFK